MARRWHRASALLLFAVLGCTGGPKVASVKGQLQDNGTPLKVNLAGLPPGDQGIRVEFLQLKDGNVADRYAATVNPDDGTFTVPGPKTRGIPPGKYRITVALGAFGAADRFAGAFEEDNSPLTVDIPESGAKLVVDIGRKQVQTQ